MSFDSVLPYVSNFRTIFFRTSLTHGFVFSVLVGWWILRWKPGNLPLLEVLLLRLTILPAMVPRLPAMVLMFLRSPLCHHLSFLPAIVPLLVLLVDPGTSLPLSQPATR